MPTNTPKFNLIKPLKSGKYNVDQFNTNADTIDSQIYSKTEVDTALNDKAPLVHTHPISEVVNLQTALNGKADTVHTHVKADITDFAHTHPISEVTNLQTALNGKVDKLMATNLVTNGDFSNGTTGWFGSNGGLNVLNNTLQTTGNGTSLSISVREDRVATSLQNGRREYARVRMRVRDNQAQFIRMRLYGGHSDTTINTPIQDQWYEVSAIITGNPSTETTPLVRFQLTSTYADSATANGKVLGIERPLIIDLTATFGAGNEPTKEQMDKLLSVYPNSWFNGTSEIGSIGALMRASLGGQVVTPTLLNSRTGTAQYVFSNDGLVIFRGTASGGSLNTNIFVLPENIRPIATRVFPISANNAFGVITVAANGEVRQTVGALTNVSLDGIVLKVGV